MEPITLCGAAAVVFGLWIEGESVVRMLARVAGKSAVVAGVMTLITAGPGQVSVNRYVPYHPR